MSWAYLAYPHGKDVLKELFIANGDNVKIKNDIIRKIELEGSGDFNESDYKNLMTSGSKELFNIFSTVAGLSF